MKRSFCLLTHARSGSEIVMRYLTTAGFDSAGEMLCDGSPTKYSIRRSNGASDDAPYLQKWHCDPVQVNSAMLNNFFRNEFALRLKTLTEHHRPVVVKAFTSSMFFAYRPIAFERLFDSFDVVVVRRRDSWRQLLSIQICGQLHAWHPQPGDELDQALEKLSRLKFQIGLEQFLWSIQVNNALKIMHDNIAAFGPRHRAICYEDFAEAPRERLNALLGYDVKELDLPVKFIQDHEAHVENVQELRALYDKYALKD